MHLALQPSSLYKCRLCSFPVLSRRSCYADQITHLLPSEEDEKRRTDAGQREKARMDHVCLRELTGARCRPAADQPCTVSEPTAYILIMPQACSSAA